MDDHTSRPTIYNSDFYAWTNEQAALLRQGRFAEADVENIAEELESLGRSEERELVNRLTVLLAHLLKWQFQPAWRGKSWRLTIKEQRNQLMDHLGENPSLRPKLKEAITRAYGHAVLEVQKETNLQEGDLAAACPYTPEQVMDTRFLPQ